MSDVGPLGSRAALSGRPPYEPVTTPYEPVTTPVRTAAVHNALRPGQPYRLVRSTYAKRGVQAVPKG